MKKFNYFAMGLLAAATVSFSACSSDDINSTSQNQADGFYMTLTIKTPTSNGTRTAQTTNTKDATKAESDVKEGTFYLVDASGNTVYTKTFSESDWKNSTIPTQGTNGETQVTIPVQNVKTDTEYTVYFLANANDAKPWDSKTYSVPTTGTFNSKFAGDYDKSNAFVMFNENDADRKANQYKVTFTDGTENTEDNRLSTTPASVKVNGSKSAIYIERVTARIDEPTSKATTINSSKPANYSSLSAAEQKKIDDALSKVSSVEMTRYAISNLSNTTYIMQNWDENYANLSIPSSVTGFSYIQPTSEFGSETEAKNLSYFVEKSDAKATTKKVDYVFENNSSDAKTTMYFEYKINLDASKFSDTPDCTDGTFYRYENKIYRSIDAIYAAYATSTGIFDGKTAEQVKSELKFKTDETTSTTTISATESELKKFREDYTIEVFRGGLAYYQKTIKDANYNVEQIFRNTIYQLTVNNVYNIGADVPNGNPDEVKAMYYLDVEVAVLPWVLSTQDVDLK
jgi:hypothetical protein